MKVSKIIVGNEYYVPCKWSCKSCTKVTVLEIINKNQIKVKASKGDPFVIHRNLLHTTALKAVSGYKQHHKKKKTQHSNNE